MNAEAKPITILMADDDPDDRLLTADALKEARLINDIRFVENGEELLDYLRRSGKFSPPADAPRPGLILLDLNMPRKDGRTVLKELKQDIAHANSSYRQYLQHQYHGEAKHAQTQSLERDKLREMKDRLNFD